MTVGRVIKSVSQRNAKILEAAMFAEAKFLDKTLTKLATDQTHHIVAQAAEKAAVARAKLAEFGININHPANGVFLPGTLKSPNPKGSIVHAILSNNKAYYKTVEKALDGCKSKAEVLDVLRQLGKTLEDGTFFHANL